jgi:hypothetical protein
MIIQPISILQYSINLIAITKMTSMMIMTN